MYAFLSASLGTIMAGESFQSASKVLAEGDRKPKLWDGQGLSQSILDGPE